MRPLLLRYRPGAQTQQFLNRRARQLQALVRRRGWTGLNMLPEPNEFGAVDQTTDQPLHASGPKPANQAQSS